MALLYSRGITQELIANLGCTQISSDRLATHHICCHSPLFAPTAVGLSTARTTTYIHASIIRPPYKYMYTTLLGT